jgi:alkylhydroperoxidase/carboxymuconolactone decarboxylase family protein YurZ
MMISLRLGGLMMGRDLRQETTLGRHVSPGRTIEAMLGDLQKVAASKASPVFRVLDARTRGLVAIGAAVAMGASTSTYRSVVDQALAAGATIEECIGACFAVASAVGAARMVAAAPRIAAALGYDIDRALE